ncbi:MAG: MlaD family protein [Ferruginibacter sp.]|nr:MCE family protein [Ferruginibacter sp.]
MKISNETKVGAIAIFSLALLLLGFNFLKGKKLWSNDTVIYGNYNNVQGLQNSNPVVINGMQVGTVYTISSSKDLRQIIVAMNITNDVNIPANSIASIKPNLLGTPSIEIELGNATTFLKNKDSIPTGNQAGMVNEILKKVDPVLLEMKNALGSVDTLLGSFNNIVDPNAKNNIAVALANLNKITASLLSSGASLNAILNNQTGALAKTLNNANSITGNFATNNEKINGVFTNLDKTTTKLAALDLQHTLDTLNNTISSLQKLVGSIESNNGTVGKLLNDPTLYKNFASTGNKLNLLLDDVRTNPRRYINISLFGKKHNKNPLLLPVPDTINSPYFVEETK